MDARLRYDLLTEGNRGARNWSPATLRLGWLHWDAVFLDHRESILHTKDKIYIGVDNTTVLEGNAGRPAVRIESKKSSLAAWSGDGGFRGWLALDSSCHLHGHQLHLVVAEATMVGCLSWNWIMFRQLVVLGLLFGCLVTMRSIRGPVGVSTTSWMLGTFRQITFKTSTSKPVVHCVGSLSSLNFRAWLNRDLRWHVRPSQGVDSYAGLCILDIGVREGFQNVAKPLDSLDSYIKRGPEQYCLKKRLPVSVSPRMKKAAPPWTVYVSVFHSQSQPTLASWKKHFFNEQSSRPPLHGA